MQLLQHGTAPLETPLRESSPWRLQKVGRSYQQQSATSIERLLFHSGNIPFRGHVAHK